MVVLTIPGILMKIRIAMAVIIYRVLVGALLLCFGRRLFWLFVGVLGFVIASEMTVELLAGAPAFLRLLISIVAGFAGVLIAIWMQKVAVSLAGFMAGGYFLTLILDTWELQSRHHSWIFFVIGGIAGSILMIWMFDWTLIILSSATGTNLIVHSFHMNHSMAACMVVVLFALGIVVQCKVIKPKQGR
jgi:hypothetical protein